MGAGYHIVNTLRVRQNSRRFTDDIFKRISLNKKYEFWLNFHWSSFLRVQIKAWRWTGDKPLSEPVVVWFTDKYITQPQWVKIPYQLLVILAVIVAGNGIFKLESWTHGYMPAYIRAVT